MSSLDSTCDILGTVLKLEDLYQDEPREGYVQAPDINRFRLLVGFHLLSDSR